MKIFLMIVCFIIAFILLIAGISACINSKRSQASRNNMKRIAIYNFADTVFAMIKAREEYYSKESFNYLGDVTIPDIEKLDGSVKVIFKLSIECWDNIHYNLILYNGEDLSSYALRVSESKDHIKTIIVNGMSEEYVNSNPSLEESYNKCISVTYDIIQIFYDENINKFIKFS